DLRRRGPGRGRARGGRGRREGRARLPARRRRRRRGAHAARGCGRPRPEGRRGDALVRLGVAAAVVEGVLVPGDVEVADGALVAAGLSPAGRGLAIPGLVDLQVNGYAGVDFASADAAGYRRAGEELLADGVTAYQPTVITAPEDEL